MIKNYFKIAWRNILKNKSASIINLTGLSLGMAAAILIMFWVQNEMNFDNYHPDADRIYHVKMGRAGDAATFWGTPEPLAETVEQQIPEIEKASKIIPANNANTPILHINESLFREKAVAYINKEWFNMFRYEFTAGNANRFNQNPNSIIVTETLAKKYFANKNALNETIRIDSINYQVAGVIKNNPANSSFQYSIFLPMENYSGERRDWMNFNAETYILARKNADISKIQKSISSIFQHQEQLKAIVASGEKKDTLEGRLTGLTKMHFAESAATASQFYGGDKTIVTIFTILGLLLLVIACINYVNLSTAKASMRSKEVSIKKIIGADTKNLFVQFMVESILTSLTALLLTLLIVRLSLPWFNSLTEKTFTLSLNSLALWEVLLGTLFTTILLTGIYPALLLSSFKPLNVLRGVNVLKIKNTTLRKTLVTTQFIIAVALSICALVILKQLAFIQHSNEGYDRKQIFSFSIPGSFINTNMVADKSSMIKLVKNELLKETAIEHVTASTDDIQQIAMSMSGIADWVGRKKDKNPGITLLSVDPDFRNIFKLKLKEGRWFMDNAGDQHNYILSETTVSQLGLKKPYLGQYFAIMQDTGRIIGIVKDFHFESFHQKITAAVLCARPDMKGTLFIQANTVKMKTALAKAETVFLKFFPQLPFEYKFMDATFENMYRADSKTATLVSVFSGIALFISCLGLFGLVSFTAEQRTKEIGIRKILGATVINLTTLLSKEFVKLVIIAIIIASPIAWWAMNKWLEAFAYKINISWWMFGITGIAALFIALTTVSVQALKAAMANPVKSLRTE